MKISESMILAAVFAATIVSPSFAQNDQRATMRVVTSDLDLSTTNDQRILAQRIARAATILCDQLSERMDAKVRRLQRECRKNAIIAATPAVLARTKLAISDR